MTVADIVTVCNAIFKCGPRKKINSMFDFHTYFHLARLHGFRSLLERNQLNFKCQINYKLQTT